MLYLTHSFNFIDEFTAMFPDLFGKSKEQKMASRTITFAVTEQCNLRCTYCYQHNKRNVSMTKETAREAIDKLYEEDANDSHYLNKENAVAIVLEFIGGEPLLEIELVQYITDYFIRKAIILKHRWATNFMISISTNGIMWKDPRVQNYLKMYGSKVSFGITIDGNKDLHDECRVFPDGRPSYDIVEHAMKEYMKMNPNNSTKLTLAPENIRFLCDAIKNLYQEFNLKFVFANVVFEKGWKREHAIIQYEQMKLLADWILEDADRTREFRCSMFDEELGKPMTDEDNNNWCGGTGCMMAVTSDGNISPCIRYTDYNLNFIQEAMVIGNIKDGFESNQKEKYNIELLESITRRSQSTDECYYCPVAKGCSWCSAYHYEIFGTPNKRATYICEMHKSRVLANVYFYNKLFLKYDIEGLTWDFDLYLSDEEALNYISQEELNMLKQMISDARKKVGLPPNGKKMHEDLVYRGEIKTWNKDVKTIDELKCDSSNCSLINEKINDEELEEDGWFIYEKK